MSSKLGLLLSGIYILGSMYLISTQGLFGESFIVIILGAPWSFLTVLLGFNATNTLLLYVLFLTPLFLNAIFLYWIGTLLQRASSK
jgi:hypothetical protein